MGALKTKDIKSNVFQGIYSFIQQVFIEYSLGLETVLVIFNDKYIGGENRQRSLF